MTTRDMSALFEAQHIAIVGSSSDPAKYGFWLSKGALSSNAEVSLVNRATPSVLGRRAYGSLRELPVKPDLVVLATPAQHFQAEVEAALHAGARSLVGITSGVFRDSHHKQAVVNEVREAGAVLLGPNCMGLADTARDLHLLWGELPAGPIGLISQSGNIALEIGNLAASVGLGVSRFASIGDQADVRSYELIGAVAAAPQTKVVAMYIEDVQDGDAFGAELSRLTASGTPVVILCAGSSAAGSRAASSHTGSMVSSSATMDAVCRAAGAIRVRTPGQLVDVCSVLVSDSVPQHHRIAVLADGGGHGIVASDTLEASGFTVPVLTAQLQSALGECLPAHATVTNPIDMSGGERELGVFADLVGDLVESDEVDAVLLSGYFGWYGSDSAERGKEEILVSARIGDLSRRSKVPVVVHSMGATSGSAETLRSAGIPVFGRVEDAVAAIHAPYAASPAGWPRREDVRAVPTGDAYWVARELLKDRGVAFPAARRVSTVEDAVEAAESIGYPVAVKVTGVDHKTEVGGVGLNLHDHRAVAGFSRQILSTLPGKDLSVEQMMISDNAVELIVGTRQDPRFGTVVLVGVGGVQAELMDDRVITLGPVTADQALRMLDSLKIAPLFHGFRGRPELDRYGAAQLIAAVSRTADEIRLGVGELEVNPVLVTPTGAVALDAHLVRRDLHG